MNANHVQMVGSLRRTRPEGPRRDVVVPGSPIYITWDQVIDGRHDILGAAAQAVNDLQAYSPQTLTVEFHGSSWTQGDWGSTSWYTQQCKRPNGQIDTRLLGDMYHNEPWQDTPHIDLVLLSEDITFGTNNFVFGAAQGRVSIQSLYRFLQYTKDQQLIDRMVHWVVAHELGHLLGLVSENETNHVDLRQFPENLHGLYHGHCQNLCYMAQVMSPMELHQRLEDLIGHPMLCPDCQRILARG